MKFPEFFSNLQEAPWYRAFLNPVIEEVGSKKTLLDIGTGSGKMIQILTSEKDGVCTGVDTDAAMLEEAKVKLGSLPIELVEIKPNETLPFEDKSFDVVTICSVLFHLKKEDMDIMLNDSLRLLKEHGKIIILTPTGSGGLAKLSRYFFSIKNTGIYVWYRATKKRAKKWTQENYLKEYASTHKLTYKREEIMKGFAQVEVINN
jgi:ubiquinone/menaquinone biosynthesis C-methylase UbiE